MKRARASSRACAPARRAAATRSSAFNGQGAIYEDNVQSFTTTEPAIDLTASSMLAFSWQISAPSPLAGEAAPARELVSAP